MQHSIRKVSRGILGALVVGALGFGATQALASPAAAAREMCTKDERMTCHNYCNSLYGSGWLGECTSTEWGVDCQCYRR